MREKIKIPVYTYVTCIDGIYREERREYTDRRKKNLSWKFYERRKFRDPRAPDYKGIDITT